MAANFDQKYKLQIYPRYLKPHGRYYEKCCTVIFDWKCGLWLFEVEFTELKRSILTMKRNRCFNNFLIQFVGDYYQLNIFAFKKQVPKAITFRKDAEAANLAAFAAALKTTPHFSHAPDSKSDL